MARTTAIAAYADLERKLHKEIGDELFQALFNPAKYCQSQLSLRFPRIVEELKSRRNAVASDGFKGLAEFLEILDRRVRPAETCGPPKTPLLELLNLLLKKVHHESPAEQVFAPFLLIAFKLRHGTVGIQYRPHGSCVDGLNQTESRYNYQSYSGEQVSICPQHWERRKDRNAFIDFTFKVYHKFRFSRALHYEVFSSKYHGEQFRANRFEAILRDYAGAAEDEREQHRQRVRFLRSLKLDDRKRLRDLTDGGLDVRIITAGHIRDDPFKLAMEVVETVCPA